jgi:hypothetical protein
MARTRLVLAAAAVLLLAGGGFIIGSSAAVGFDGDSRAPSDMPNEPVQNGPVVAVATGATPGGTPWSLAAYQSNLGLCLDLQGVTQGNLGGEACGFDVPEQRAVSVVTNTFGQPAVTFVYGPVASSVTDVTVTLGDGRTLAVPTTPSPGDLQFGGAFFAAVVSGSTDVASVVAKNARGVTVDRR